MCRPALPWFAMRLETIVNAALFPIYVPICAGMWLYFYALDMQRCHDEGMAGFARMSQAIADRQNEEKISA